MPDTAGCSQVGSKGAWWALPSIVGIRKSDPTAPFSPLGRGVSEEGISMLLLKDHQRAGWEERALTLGDPGRLKMCGHKQS